MTHICPFYNKSLARNLHVLFIHQNFNISRPSIERNNSSESTKRNQTKRSETERNETDRNEM
jgi:hypothetical protein